MAVGEENPLPWYVDWIVEEVPHLLGLSQLVREGFLRGLRASEQMEIPPWQKILLGLLVKSS